MNKWIITFLVFINMIIIKQNKKKNKKKKKKKKKTKKKSLRY